MMSGCLAKERPQNRLQQAIRDGLRGLGWQFLLVSYFKYCYLLL